MDRSLDYDKCFQTTSAIFKQMTLLPLSDHLFVRVWSVDVLNMATRCAYGTSVSTDNHHVTSSTAPPSQANTGPRINHLSEHLSQQENDTDGGSHSGNGDDDDNNESDYDNGISGDPSFSRASTVVNNVPNSQPNTRILSSSYHVYNSQNHNPELNMATRIDFLTPTVPRSVEPCDTIFWLNGTNVPFKILMTLSLEEYVNFNRAKSIIDQVTQYNNHYVNHNMMNRLPHGTSELTGIRTNPHSATYQYHHSSYPNNYLGPPLAPAAYTPAAVEAQYHTQQQQPHGRQQQPTDWLQATNFQNVPRNQVCNSNNHMMYATTPRY